MTLVGAFVCKRGYLWPLQRHVQRNIAVGNPRIAFIDEAVPREVAEVVGSFGEARQRGGDGDKVGSVNGVVFSAGGDAVGNVAAIYSILAGVDIHQVISVGFVLRIGKITGP